MALTGDLSDLSLSELIEFFCNQRKIGRLKVLYPQGAGYFYLQTGSVVDARIGVLRGIEAVYYALTLPNANFEFSGSVQATDRTINQPWTQVVLEGLRRLDEGITPADAFPAGYIPEPKELEKSDPKPALEPEIHASEVPTYLSSMEKSSIARRKPLVAGAIALALIGSVAVVGIPAGWYVRAKLAVAQKESVNFDSPQLQDAPATVSESPTVEGSNAATNNSSAPPAKRLREKEKARAREEKATTLNQSSTLSATKTAAPSPVKIGPKKIAVTVTYDESGRVTQASGGDATALRIARQKRFPAGKGGSATVTIPMN